MASSFIRSLARSSASFGAQATRPGSTCRVTERGARVGHGPSRVGEPEHKILLTAPRPNLIPRAELGQNVKRRDFRGKVAGRAAIERMVGGTGGREGGRVAGRGWRAEGGRCADLVEINLPVDGSPRARIRVYICTYSTPRAHPARLRHLSSPRRHQLFAVPTVTPATATAPSSPPRFLSLSLSPSYDPVWLAPRSGKDRLINSAPLVINSTLVGGDRGADFGNKTAAR